jgi:HAD superfamily hydrolase (TIGR01490 family)
MRLTLFDLDGTLLPKDSDHAFGEFLVQHGWADADTFRRRNDEFFAAYQAGALDMAAYVDFATAPWRDRSAPELARLQEAFMAEVVAPMLLPAARRLVQAHASAGDHMALVTATNDVVTRPIATALGLQTLIATELVRDGSGRCTGAIAGVPCFREGKVQRVEAWLARLGLERKAFERVTVYSDSTNDLPLMRWASHPVATNPSAELEHEARSSGWPILRLFA